jgi:hypothetical protein
VISITRDEYCRFSIKGRLRLLDLFGKIVFEKITKTEEVIVFKLFDFYVAVTKDFGINAVVEANPLSSDEVLQFIFLCENK